MIKLIQEHKALKSLLIIWPKVFFYSYLGVVLLAILYFKPGWGFMDDAQNIELCRDFWSGKISYLQILTSFINQGRFLPVYYIWIILAYTIHMPILIYLFIYVVNFTVLLLWGKIMQEIFFVDKKDFFTQYIYPLLALSFFPFNFIFLSISSVEKFVYIFATLAFYTLIKAYNKVNIKIGIVSIVFVILAMGSKETALALMVSFFVFAVFDLCWIRLAPRLSRWLALISVTIIISYGYFIFGILKGYTAGYKKNLNFVILLKNLIFVGLKVKVILVLALFLIILYFYLGKNHKSSVKSFFLIIPIFLLTYITVLLPWPLYDYLLASLSPFLWASGYFFYSFTSKTSSWVLITLRILIIIVVVFELIGGVIPRIRDRKSTRLNSSH